MSYNEAKIILDYHIRWRKGEFLDPKYTFKEITQALEVIMNQNN